MEEIRISSLKVESINMYESVDIWIGEESVSLNYAQVLKLVVFLERQVSRAI